MEKKQFQAKAYVDGNILESRAWLRYRLSQVWDKVYERDGGDFKRSSLQFSPIPTTDDPTLVTIDPITMSKIGTIEIDLEEGTLVETGVQEARSSQLSSGTVYEKGKKFAYSVSGSDSTVCEIPKVMHYTFVPDSHKKFTHRFIFRYRPRAVLVQMRIIDEPEPSLTPAPRPARKRKLDAIDVDATPEGEDEDVKPDLNAKRVKYLEEQVKHLADQLKRSRNGIEHQISSYPSSEQDPARTECFLETIDQPSPNVQRRKGVELNAKVGDEKAKNLTDSKEVYAGPTPHSHFYSAQSEVFYQFTFDYRSRVKLKLKRVIEEPEEEDAIGGKLSTDGPSTPAESSNSSQKKVIPKAKFADAIDLSEDPPRRSPEEIQEEEGEGITAEERS
uniref:DUF7918 domain-containing protein n=1 Tax=Kwoniella bestiolae CBS 10118 TaxID=1296100 RepID=A0A1B9GE93_9TREE|nr:hypothetical protein I302_00848 [Kwoniella bestiolae CBS 10118]OCF29346.1 hypothetical protein I302_00848 [Kwoniella bestiolae CBS 10118]